MPDDVNGGRGRKWHGQHYGSRGMGAAYFLGFLGAAVYYIQNAATFGGGIIGFLKACVWPAFLVYQALQFMRG